MSRLAGTAFAPKPIRNGRRIQVAGQLDHVCGLHPGHRGAVLGAGGAGPGLPGRAADVRPHAACHVAAASNRTPARDSHDGHSGLHVPGPGRLRRLSPDVQHERCVAHVSREHPREDPRHPRRPIRRIRPEAGTDDPADSGGSRGAAGARGHRHATGGRQRPRTSRASRRLPGSDRSSSRSARPASSSRSCCSCCSSGRICAIA